MRIEDINSSPNWRETKIEECELRIRTIHSLTKAGFTSLGEIEGLEWEYLKTLDGFGRVCLNDINALFEQIDGSELNISLTRAARIMQLQRERMELSKEIGRIDMAIAKLSD